MVIPAGYGKSKLFKLRPLHTDLKEELNDGLEFKDEGEVMLAQSEFNVLNVKLVRRPLPEPIKHAVEAVKTLQRNVVLQFQRFIPPSSVLDKSPFYDDEADPLHVHSSERMQRLMSHVDAKRQQSLERAEREAKAAAQQQKERARQSRNGSVAKKNDGAAGSTTLAAQHHHAHAHAHAHAHGKPHGGSHLGEGDHTCSKFPQPHYYTREPPIWTVFAANLAMMAWLTRTVDRAA